MSGPSLRISDHALVRFLERAGGHDIDGMREALSRSLGRARKAAETLGASEYAVIADGLEYVIRDDVVVTVLPRGRSA